MSEKQSLLLAKISCDIESSIETLLNTQLSFPQKLLVIGIKTSIDNLYERLDELQSQQDSNKNIIKITTIGDDE